MSKYGGSILVDFDELGVEEFVSFRDVLCIWGTCFVFAAMYEGALN